MPSEHFAGAGVEWIEIGAVKPAERVVGDEGRIGHQNAGPSPHPLVGDVELAGGQNGAAKVPRLGRARAVFGSEKPRIQLINAGGPDRVGAVDQPLIPLGLQHRALLRHELRIEGQVVVGREIKIIGGLDADPVRAAGRECRKEKAALALDRRVRGRQERKIGDRQSKKIDRSRLRNKSSSRCHHE